MEKWKKDSRKEAMVVDIDMLVPKAHLLRKIEKVMDYDWLYENEPFPQKRTQNRRKKLNKM